jgi:HK97 gp10 family phage protein
MAGRVVFNPLAMAELFSPTGPLAAKMIEMAEEIAAQARQRAPYDAADDEHTHVRNAIKVEVTPNIHGVEVRVASTATDSQGRPVGLFVEVGTRHMTAEPYLRPAFDAIVHHA